MRLWPSFIMRRKIAARLRAIQSTFVGRFAAEVAAGNVLPSTVREAWAEVGEIYGVSKYLAAPAEMYAVPAVRRLCRAGGCNVVYEANRAVNAANHEAIRLARGVKTPVRWIGGANHGQVQLVSDTWGKYRHPPLSSEAVDCFLVPDKS
jgi:hypothetical protein